MKEYWTDTILEKPVPAGTDVKRGEPVRIYRADTVDEEMEKVRVSLNMIGQAMATLEDRNLDLEDRNKTRDRLYEECQGGWKKALVEIETAESKLRAQGKLLREYYKKEGEKNGVAQTEHGIE